MFFFGFRERPTSAAVLPGAPHEPRTVIRPPRSRAFPSVRILPVFTRLRRRRRPLANARQTNQARVALRAAARALALASALEERKKRGENRSVFFSCRTIVRAKKSIASRGRAWCCVCAVPSDTSRTPWCTPRWTCVCRNPTRGTAFCTTDTAAPGSRYLAAAIRRRRDTSPTRDLSPNSPSSQNPPSRRTRRVPAIRDPFRTPGHVRGST